MSLGSVGAVVEAVEVLVAGAGAAAQTPDEPSATAAAQADRSAVLKRYREEFAGFI